jgi:hypothetical protein
VIVLAQSPTSVADTSDPRKSTHSCGVAWEPASSNDKDVDEPIPARLGRYAVRRLIDSGGFGVVDLAYDETLQLHVAIKVPHRGRISRPQDIEAYLVEARIVARFKQLQIVPVYDVGQLEDGRCFVVSEFIEGRNLASQLKQHRPSPTEATQLVVSIAETLHAAHDRKIVHRDVKPSNILLDSAGKPYLSDFGLALREEEVEWAIMCRSGTHTPYSLGNDVSLPGRYGWSLENSNN